MATENMNKKEIETEFFYPLKEKGRTLFYKASWKQEVTNWEIFEPVTYVLAPIRKS